MFAYLRRHNDRQFRVTCEMGFAAAIVSGGVAGLSVADMRQYLEFIADQRLMILGLNKA